MAATQTTSTNPDARLKDLGITLPSVTKPLAAYVHWVRTGNLVYISGQLPMKDGKVAFTGKAGKDLDLAKVQEAARLCAINTLAILKEAAGGLDKVVRIVRTTGHVNAAAGFTDVHLVNNAASDLFQQVFGEAGRHSRASLGAAELPLNAAFELELIAEVR